MSGFTDRDQEIENRITRLEATVNKSNFSVGLSAQFLAEELRKAGLNGMQDFEKLGMSNEAWDDYRLFVAKNLIERNIGMKEGG